MHPSYVCRHLDIPAYCGHFPARLRKCVVSVWVVGFPLITLFICIVLSAQSCTRMYNDCGQLCLNKSSNFVARMNSQLGGRLKFTMREYLSSCSSTCSLSERACILSIYPPAFGIGILIPVVVYLLRLPRAQGHSKHE
jgi:hypothetical protein